MNQDHRYWSPQLGSQNFMLLLILNTNLLIRKSKIGYPQNTIWDRLDWEPAVITATLYVHRLMGRAFRFYIPIYKVLEQTWKYFTSLKLCKCSQIPHSLPRIVSTPNRTKTNHHQLNHRQTTRTHTHQVTRPRSRQVKRGSFQTPETAKGNLDSCPFLNPTD